MEIKLQCGDVADRRRIIEQIFKFLGRFDSRCSPKQLDRIKAVHCLLFAEDVDVVNLYGKLAIREEMITIF